MNYLTKYNQLKKTTFPDVNSPKKNLKREFIKFRYCNKKIAIVVLMSFRTLCPVYRYRYFTNVTIPVIVIWLLLAN